MDGKILNLFLQFRLKSEVITLLLNHSFIGIGNNFIQFFLLHLVASKNFIKGDSEVRKMRVLLSGFLTLSKFE